MQTDSQKPQGSSVSKHLRTYLASGILVLVPLGLTVFVFKLLFTSLSGIMLPVLRPLLRDLPEWALVSLAFFSMLIIVYIVGLVAAHMIGRRVIQLGETLLMRVPFIKTVYSASKQVVDSISSPGASAYKAVALVEYPLPGTLALAFVTGSTRTSDDRVYITVFVPTTPNPTSGFMLFVPEADVRILKMSVEDAVKTIFSGGMLGPARMEYRSAPLQHMGPAREGELPSA
ncbi:MAG: DUF502 domain-containing protein [Calditrichaeota bacterium]|nr:DUF502 domain-containing protein [Calditrichota bacterium]